MFPDSTVFETSALGLTCCALCSGHCCVWGQRAAVVLTLRTTEHESHFLPFSFFYISASTHHLLIVNSDFRFCSFFYLPMFIALIGFPLDQTFPSLVCCCFAVYCKVFCPEEHCRLKYITYIILGKVVPSILPFQ